ncbi:hypothetical protein GCM10022222_64040 [Amycolatopsis ultiminotia]|uniref:Uncharacterized protein n=1 Tax=Amycolatopsis ultiminotia TaxID=543629 RepID=A0ABP6XQQ5_9PSEU
MAEAAGAPAVDKSSEVYREARALVEAVLDLSPRLGPALVTAFERGVLDVPYCLHPDNRGAARSCIDGDGRLRWTRIGGLPIAGIAAAGTGSPMTDSGLLEALSYVSRRSDEGALEHHEYRTVNTGSSL